jgi:methylase of polypeptide subunit release factors
MTDEASMAFGSLTIRFDSSGLPPRRWTAMQSLWAAELLPTLPAGDVLELCAGVGHIGLLALAEADRRDGADPGAHRRLVQVDEDESVCRLAERNAEEVGLAERVAVRRGVAEDALRPEERFALVIADPPWVPTDRVVDHPDDPPSAIDGGPDGLDVVRALLPVVERHLHPSGAALLQVGGRDQVEAVRGILRSTGSALRVADLREAPAGRDGAVALLVARDLTVS